MFRGKKRCQMSIQYDHKMKGLLVDVTEEELKNIATEVCNRNERVDLLDKDIHHVTYIPPVSEKPGKKRSLFWLGLALFLWLLILAVMFSGLYQIGKWTIDWIY